MSKNILYIHGMGGGGDSRIPSILVAALADKAEVVARTYDFDPEIAAVQISSWVDEIKPVLVIGESLGAIHAMRIPDVPKLFISPALNAPLYFELMAWLTLVPGMTLIFDRIYRPKEGDRQKLHFTFGTLRKYCSHRRHALEMASCGIRKNSFKAFFGTADHYRKSGVVSVRTWKKHFGQTFSMYEGTHFMEEEHIYALLVPEICNALNVK